MKRPQKLSTLSNDDFTGSRQTLHQHHHSRNLVCLSEFIQVEKSKGKVMSYFQCPKALFKASRHSTAICAFAFSSSFAAFDKLC